MVNIQNKKCVVIGGGKVALRKTKTLLKYGAEVTLVSPVIDEEIRKLFYENKIEIIERNYEYGDLEGGILAYIATDNGQVNELVLKESNRKNILVNCAKNPEDGDFIIPSSIRKGSLSISIGTDGKSPMLAKKIKEDLELVFNDGYETFIEELGKIRKISIDNIEDIKVRRELFKELVYGPLLDEFMDKNIDNLEDEMKKVYMKYKVGSNTKMHRKR
ncbi:precorrin-2 dehydrogenase/sirohydrochlorin ferrochelatase family protein [Anaeromicrobium sp.]|uniref:precorrin-2 dehydrogenase/sirohydrochlorin ferrochelatase family protein n=1 Tax=Anaeromicrobium sp. TaxID=1929132 RepID=UPI0025D78ADD|nr:bifunctional precorrin-2 dehydrogenase/sirohydrochlorin ferrochelatase [Anaeromicrobium sp.]